MRNPGNQGLGVKVFSELNYGLNEVSSESKEVRTSGLEEIDVMGF